MKNLLVIALLFALMISCTNSVAPTEPSSSTRYMRVKSVKNGKVVDISTISSATIK